MGLFGFLKSKSAEDWYDDAILRIAARKEEEALKSFQRAAELGSLEALYRCGMMYDKLKKPEKALEAYQAAAEKGHELAALVVVYREQVPDILSRVLDLKSLPRLRPLPDNPRDFTVAEEPQILSDEQAQRLELIHSRYRQAEALMEKAEKADDQFYEEWKAKKFNQFFFLAGNGTFTFDKEKIRAVEEWLDMELALLGDCNAQNRTADHIRKLAGKPGSAAETYWRLRSAQQGCLRAIAAIKKPYRRKFDLNGYLYWDMVGQQCDPTVGSFFCVDLSSEALASWYKADKKAEPQRKRALEEYPDGAPTEFRFAPEGQNPDKAKLKKLFDAARQAYKNGNQKEARLAYQRAAFLGDAEAQFRYGRMLIPNYTLKKFRHEQYHNKAATPPLQNLWEAAFWLTKSAKQGNYKACWEMFRLYSESLLTLLPNTDEMLFWMILAVRAEQERPLGTVSDEGEAFTPYSAGRLWARYSAVRQAVKQVKPDQAEGNDNFQKIDGLDPVAEAMYRVGLFYESNDCYGLAVPMHVQAARRHSGIAAEHLQNLKRRCWYDDAAEIVAMPKVKSGLISEKELRAYATNGDLDAAMCLADAGSRAWGKVVSTAVTAAAKQDPVCDYLDTVIHRRFSSRQFRYEDHIFFRVHELMSICNEERCLAFFEKSETAFFVCGMDMKVICGKANRARQRLEAREREVEREMAMEELEEQMQEQRRKIDAFNAEMTDYVDNLVLWHKAEDYGAFGIYASQSVVDQIEEKHRRLKEEYDL